MDLTLNLGSNREEFIEKLATYRYLSRYLPQRRQTFEDETRFFTFMIDKVNDNTVDIERNKYKISEEEEEEEIKAKLKEIEAREQAGGGKKSRKKSRKHKKRKSKKSRKHRRKTKSHYRR